MPQQKIDSNLTGLAIAEEQSPKVLPGTPIWYPMEPNSYNDFGGQLSTVVRNPINPGRQRKKGTVTDLDASGGFSQDLTILNTPRILQGFFLADWREKATTAPMNSAAVVITGATAATPGVYTAAAGLGAFKVGAMVLASGFTNVANNGLKTVTAAAAGQLTVSQATVAETPPAAAKIETCGFRFASAAASIAVNGKLTRLVLTGFDLTTLGLIPGEWVFLGDDTASNRFANNSGWARIGSITATYIEFDKTSWTGVAEAGTGKTISLFFGHFLQNETDTNLIKRRTYQLERSLGRDDNGVQSEYLLGAVPNELTINIPQADKITIDMGFIAVDNEQRNGTQGLKGGTRATLGPADAFNTSSDFSRIKLGIVDPEDSAVSPLFAFATEMTITLNNNVSPAKAIGVLGAFDTTVGTFEVGGSMTAYFSTVDAVAAVRNNSDVTFDVVMAKANIAYVWDIPLMSLGDGRLNVEQDQAIRLPLEMNAAESKNKTTLTVGNFPYVPNVAM